MSVYRLLSGQVDRIHQDMAEEALKGARYLLPLATHNVDLKDLAAPSPSVGSSAALGLRLLSRGIAACDRLLASSRAAALRPDVPATAEFQKRKSVLLHSLLRASALPVQPWSFELPNPMEPGSLFGGARLLAASRALPTVQAALAALAEALTLTRSISADSVKKGGPNTFHSTLNYESIGRICVLQVQTFPTLADV